MDAPILIDLYVRSLLILRAVAAKLAQLTPWWLLGVWLGATLSWWLRPRVSLLAERGGFWRGWFGLLIGAVLGLISPLSLLSLAPLLRLLARRRNLQPLVIGLAAAHPLLSPTILVFTAGVLGLSFAVWRTVAALAVALATGGALLVARPLLVWEDPNPGSILERRRYLLVLWDYVRVCGRHYLLAVLVAAWLEVLLPLRALALTFGVRGPLGVLAGAGLGLPLNMCGGAAVALADTFAQLGLSPGAVLAFLTAGPALTVRAVVGVHAIVGRRATWLYVALAFMMSWLAGLALDLGGSQVLP
jgi:hypothetical protein